MTEWCRTIALGGVTLLIACESPTTPTSTEPPAIVFDMVVDGNRDIYIVTLDGVDLRRLTTHPADDRAPTAAHGRVVWTSYRDGNAELYELRGGEQRRLTATPDRDEGDAALSPDGSRLAFIVTSGGSPRLWLASGDGRDAIPAAPAFGDEATIDGSPAWARGGDRVAFSSTAEGTADIVILVPGRMPAPLAAGASAHADVEPAWCIDETVVFASDRDGSVAVWSAPVAGSGATRIVALAHGAGQPACLADGHLVFVEHRAGGTGLAWIDPARPDTLHRIPLPGSAVGNPAVMR